MAHRKLTGAEIKRTLRLYHTVFVSALLHDERETVYVQVTKTSLRRALEDETRYNVMMSGNYIWVN